MTVATAPAFRPRAAVAPSAPGGPATRDATPPRLPAEHFAAALVFWSLGALGLVWVAPELAAGAFPAPRVVAIAHLFTLGWVTTTIQGALYQFLPVALRVPIRSTRLAHAGFVLHVPGLALFVGGMLLGRPQLMLPGAALFATGLLGFAGNLAATLRRAPQRGLTWWSLAAATLFLVCTVVLGASLAGNLRYGYLGAHRFLAVGVHLHVALAGWVMLVIVGVADHLLPMFLLSHGAPTWPGRASAALLAGGVGLLLVLHHGLTPARLAAVAVLLAAGVIAFVTQAALFAKHRRRPGLDPGMRLAGAGVALLLLGVALAPPMLVRGLAAPRLATAYGLTLVLAVSLFAAGHYYRILPFLVWLHRFGPLAGKRPVPRVGELYRAGPAKVVGGLLSLGAAGLVAAVLTGSPGAARIAAGVFAAGALGLALQMLALSRRRPA